MNEELFAVSHIQKIAEDFANKMIERNLKIEEEIITRNSDWTYTYKIKCSQRFTQEQLKARIKELVTSGEVDRVIIERELGKGIYKEILYKVLLELGDEDNG
jgi:hypothetical protein|nr:MAG TPA: hypothetical protein [Caudoviricetes sp.]